MKHFYLLVLSGLYCLSGYSQCTPDTQYTGQPLGIYPDTVTTCGHSASFTFVSATEFLTSDWTVIATKIVAVTAIGPFPSPVEAYIEDFITTDAQFIPGSPSEFGIWPNEFTSPGYNPVLGCINIEVPAVYYPYVAGYTIELQFEIDLFIENSQQPFGDWSSIWGLGTVTLSTWVSFVDQGASPSITFNSAPPVCFETSTGSVEAVVSGDHPPFIYNWNTGETVESLTDLASGVYTISVTDACGTTVSDSVQLPPGASPTVTLTPFIDICTRHEAFDVSSGSALGGYATPPGGYFLVDGIPDPVFNPAVSSVGTHTVSYVYTDLNNCTGTATQQLELFQAPTVTIVGETEPDPQTSYEYAVDDLVGVEFTWSVTGDGQIVGNGQGNTVEIMWGTTAIGEVTVTVEESVGCVFQETLNVGGSTGINEWLDSQFNVYPNPSNGIFLFSAPDDSGSMLCRITNTSGKVVYESKIMNSEAIDLSYLSNGFYCLQVITAKGVVTKRLIKQ